MNTMTNIERAGKISKKLQKHSNGNFIAEAAVFDAVLRLAIDNMTSEQVEKLEEQVKLIVKK